LPDMLLVICRSEISQIGNYQATIIAATDYFFPDQDLTFQQGWIQDRLLILNFAGAGL
jgi:hypothetical protein